MVQFLRWDVEDVRESPGGKTSGQVCKLAWQPLLQDGLLDNGVCGNARLPAFDRGSRSAAYGAVSARTRPKTGCAKVAGLPPAG